MNHISSSLQNKKLKSLFNQVKQRSNSIQTIAKAIEQILPCKYHNKYQLCSYDNGIITISTSTIWITWIKSFEREIILQTQQQFNVNRIKWQVRPTESANTDIIAKYKVYISPKSAKVIAQTAKNIKQQKLKQALLRIASRTQD
jgi:hypothetical protein